MENKKLSSIVKNVENHFGFLYEKGYKIRYKDYSPEVNGGWVVEFESSNSIVYITNDREEIILELSAAKKAGAKERIAIEKMIYFLSEDKIIVEPFKGNLTWGKKKQLERLSNLLKEYIDQLWLILKRCQNELKITIHNYKILTQEQS